MSEQDKNRLYLEPYITDRGYVGLRDRQSKRHVEGVERVTLSREPNSAQTVTAVITCDPLLWPG